MQLRVMGERLRSSFWFLPILMTGLAAGLAFATVALDASISDQWLRAFGWAYAGGAEGASAVLGAVAGSMITLAGLVFSMTLVALSLTSSQFGPRLLRNFMRDTMNQVVLGTFVATFVYCLLVLRTVRRADESAFVPHLSVTIGVLMAVASLVVLIYFVHHVAMSIQADELLARVSAELFSGIDRLYPKEIGQGPPESTPQEPHAAVPDGFDREAQPVSADVDGYVQLIDADALLDLATQSDLLVRVLRRPGQYAIRGNPLALVLPRERVNDAIAGKLRAVFVIGHRRTEVQDVEFVVDQLVEIAVRALSPGINDPFTAVACVDRLGSALTRLAQRHAPSAYRYHEDQLRIIAPSITFDGVADAALNQIRQYGRTSAAVTIRLLETIGRIADSTDRPEILVTLRRHADMIARGSRDGLPEQDDRRDVQRKYDAICNRLPQPML